MPCSRFWIALSLVPDIGPVTARQLVGQTDPEQLFGLGRADLVRLSGMTALRADRILNFSGWDEVDRQMARMQKTGISALCCTDAGYPEQLNQLTDAPIVLYHQGTCLPEDRYAVAVVGSRTHTPYGAAVTQKISGELSASGFTIISGMARGIDTFAHRSALAAGGRTIAVLGSGLDICYPAENRGLMEKIAASGCVLSEFPPGTQPNRENFPRRNRLISGLSLGVLVVEAAEGSGSLITAATALEQNREVFAVPGNITARTSAGTNRLIRQGARLVSSAADIIEELAPLLRGFIRTEVRRQVQLAPEEESLCACLSDEPKHIDDVARSAGLPVHRILDILLSLELKGVIHQSDGKRFYLA